MKNTLDILFICNKSPWPPREGGPIAMNNMIEGLAAAGHRIKVLALNTNKYAVNPDDIPEEYREKTGIELVYIDLSINPVEAFLNLFSSKSYHVERFKSSAFEQKLTEILSSVTFDIVQIELVYMSSYINTIRKHSTAKIVLRAHNIEHLIWERLASSETNPLKKKYLGHLATTLRNYELGILDSYDGIVPITKKDGRFFNDNTKIPVFPVSFGINTDKVSPKGNSEQALFHIGAMNWLPNEEGIRWFIEKVWPMVHDELPEATVYLAGRAMPGWLSTLNEPGVNVVGEVDDAFQFIGSKSISIAPLLSGSGIRIKIIESMAMAKAVIATTIGAEGINYTDGEDIMIADSPEDFARAVRILYTDPEKSKTMGMKARKLIEEQHNTKKIIERLVKFYREIL